MIAAALAVAAVANLAAAVVAQAAGGDSDLDPLAYVVNFGILGIATVLWIRRSIRPGADVVDADARTARAEARAEAAETRERQLEQNLRDAVVPAMTRFTESAVRLLDRIGGPA